MVNPLFLLPFASLLVLPVGWMEFQLLPRTRLGALLAPLAACVLYGPWVFAAFQLRHSPDRASIAAGSVMLLAALILWSWASPPLLRIPGQIRVTPERLLTTGAYAWSRNPLYAGHALFICGMVLCMGATPIFLVSPILWLIADQASQYEERRILSPAFGSEFSAYRANTPRLMPSWAWLAWGVTYLALATAAIPATA